MVLACCDHMDGCNMIEAFADASASCTAILTKTVDFCGTLLNRTFIVLFYTGLLNLTNCHLGQYVRKTGPEKNIFACLAESTRARLASLLKLHFGTSTKDDVRTGS